MTKESYEVVVIGGGHAGCEAAAASARMGVNTAASKGKIMTAASSKIVAKQPPTIRSVPLCVGPTTPIMTNLCVGPTTPIVMNPNALG